MEQPHDLARGTRGLDPRQRRRDRELDRLTSVSVVIATRDRPGEVGRAVRSAIDQTHPPLEVIVVDDGDGPDRLDLDLDGDAVRVLRRDAAGGDAGAARNLGVDAARGELVAFLDDDDVWRPDKLARQLAVLGDALATACGFEAVDDKGRVVERHVPAADDLRRALLFDPVMQTSALLVRRDALERVGGFPVGRLRCEDWALFLRLAEAGPVVLQPDVLVTRRATRASASEQLDALVRFYAEEIDPRVPAADRARVQARQRLIKGVLLAQMGRRRQAAALLWRSEARRQVLRLATGERLWAVLRRLGR